MGIFKANDIRGIYPSELDETKAYKIGQSFARFVKSQTIIVGRDNRLSSPQLAHTLMQGICDSGKDIVYIGIVDSPALYFASWKFNMPGIMVTASHNPPQYNGFYLVEPKAIPIYTGNQLDKVEKLYNSNLPKSKNKGQTTRLFIYPDYVKHILAFMKYEIKKIKIVIDAGNGMGGMIAREVFKKFPQVKVVPLYFELDGRYPNRGPDPTLESNLIPLQKKVLSEKADFGLAYDGDADRVALVDDKGKIIGGSIIGALMADYLLSQSENKEKIVCSIGCTRALTEIIEKHGSAHIREKVGHSFISDHMRKVNSLFGVEQTGHFFYRQNSFAECPMITSLLLCHIYSKKSSNMSDLLKPYQKYYMTQEINFPIDNPKEFIPKFEKQLQEIYKVKIDKFDGLFIELKDLWFRIRPSQTESALRLTIEGKSKDIVDKEKDKLEAIIRKTLSV